MDQSYRNLPYLIMQTFLTTLVVRHRKENLKKCSLKGLEQRKDFHFLTYPKDPIPLLKNYVLLDMTGEELSEKDCDQGLLVIDGTWRYAAQMIKALDAQQQIPRRTLPKQYRTAYPRRQADCPDPTRGLSSLEAIFIAYQILGRDFEGLLDHYYWRDQFLQMNSELHEVEVDILL